ncbi:MAG: DUF4276 family protein [Caldilineaceae bacterium SB0665_bin_25]|nr:DUF4276 family protein [Caldilineaceae bacterium SB0665_bin_25]
MYVRLNFIVEGQTEETFVNQVLKPHLGQLSVGVSVRVVTTRKKRGAKYRGGLSTYAKAKRDITLWTKQDRNPDVRFTTMFDLYGLPTDFPGYAAAVQNDPFQRVEALEGTLARDISDARFIPYIQLHEFEALILSGPRQLSSQFDNCDEGIATLETIVSRFKSPEHVNDGTDTAPSKRIIREIPEYEGRKASAGPIVTERIGLFTLRSKCSHFAAWLDKLESLGQEN